MPNQDGLRRDFEDFKDLLLLTDVEGLTDELNNKSPLSHDHTMAEVLGLDLALGGKADAAHSHPFTDLDDTPSAYSGEALSIVRVTAAEDGLEFVPPSSILAPGSIEVGDPVIKLKRKATPTPGTGQWFQAWTDADVDAANWPLLQPFLFGIKAEAVDTLTDQFLVVNVSRTANVATLELANTDECQLLCDLLNWDLRFNSYDTASNTSSENPADFTAWAMTIEIPIAIDFIPAGRYQIIGLDRANRIISIDLAGADQGVTPVTEYLECWPFRKVGTNSVSHWRAVPDAAITMGRIPGLRNLDQIQEHVHSLGYISTPAYVAWVNPYGLFGPGGGGSTNGVLGADNRNSSITRNRSLGGYLYLYGGTYQ